ncbi:hypothetical protein NDU88_007503 [Pleurodeles waltl]|uniref:Uncharacterized protein n=1 Tax=Pleurodeles waltl TaxID=8319 RepID=A0AAV7RV40_PLEWA|nr:hypothetical protein NDU88_007503 [Pleurodeles waltl]
MPGGRSSHKNSGKPARKLLFSEALLQAKGVPPLTATQPSATHQDMADPAQESTMDHILQEISAAGRRLEGMDSEMVSLAAETKSIRMEIASFQTRVLGLEQRVSKVEAHTSSFQDRDQELIFLRSKQTDLEDGSRRDNVRFLGFPENIEGEDLQRFLQDTLPRLTGITFEPPLEFQRAHRLGPRRTVTDAHPTNHSLPSSSYTSPPTYTESTYTRSLSAGWTHNPNIGRLLQRNQRPTKGIPGPPPSTTPTGGEIRPVRSGKNVDNKKRCIQRLLRLTLFLGWFVPHGLFHLDSTPRNNGCKSEHSLPRPCPRRVRVCPPDFSPLPQGMGFEETPPQPR